MHHVIMVDVYLSWTQLSDGHSELNKGLKTAAKARSCVAPAHCDEDVLASHKVEHQDVVQLVLARVQRVRSLFVHIDLQTNVLFLS